MHSHKVRDQVKSPNLSKSQFPCLFFKNCLRLTKNEKIQTKVMDLA